MTNNSAKQRALLGGEYKRERESQVVSKPNDQFLRVFLIAGDVGWYFEWQEWAEESLRKEMVLIEKNICTGREILCDIRTVGKKTNSRLKLNCAINLSFPSCLYN